MTLVIEVEIEIDRPLYKECKSTFTQKGLGKTKTDRKYINFLSIVVATSRNMT